MFVGDKETGDSSRTKSHMGYSGKWKEVLYTLYTSVVIISRFYFEELPILL